MNPADNDPVDSDLETLSRLLDDDLDDQERRAIEARLSSEPDLGRTLDLLRFAADALRAPIAQPSAGVAEAQVHLAVQTLQAIEPTTVVPLPSPRRRRAALLTLSAAALLLLVGFVVRAGLPRPDRSEPLTARATFVAEVATADAAASPLATPEQPPRFDDVDALLRFARTGASPRTEAAQPPASTPVERQAAAATERRDPTCGADLAEVAEVAGRTVRWGVRGAGSPTVARLVVVDPVTCTVIVDQPG